MLFLRQACAAIVLVMLTLGMQSAGMAGLIEWAKSHFLKTRERPASGVPPCSWCGSPA
jgi:hypothetical protein